MCASVLSPCTFERVYSPYVDREAPHWNDAFFQVTDPCFLQLLPGLLELDQVPDLRFMPIFAPAPFKLVFRDPSLAEAFDHCYDEAYVDGVMTEIDDKYIGRFRRALGNRYLGY